MYYLSCIQSSPHKQTHLSYYTSNFYPVHKIWEKESKRILIKGWTGKSGHTIFSASTQAPRMTSPSSAPIFSSKFPLRTGWKIQCGFPYRGTNSSRHTSKALMYFRSQNTATRSLHIPTTPAEVKPRDNLTSSTWEDLATLVAKKNISVSKGDQDYCTPKSSCSTSQKPIRQTTPMGPHCARQYTPQSPTMPTKSSSVPFPNQNQVYINHAY
jgi:hypothetical protein